MGRPDVKSLRFDGPRRSGPLPLAASPAAPRRISYYRLIKGAIGTVNLRRLGNIGSVLCNGREAESTRPGHERS